jgi:ssDNA-binding Zn-finger/Zn-ribbon topoisomerase 1
MEQAIIESMPNLTPAQAVERRNTIVRFVRAAMKDGTDYGVIPGTEKKTLYKPGAEKLCTLFGLSWRLIPVDQVMDWTGKEHDGEPFFWFSYRCQLQHGGIFVGESEGSCSSWEKKYRYRQGERKCPTCGKAAIIKGKAEYGGGWLCFAKKGGCNAKFTADDKRITEQAVGQIKNPDIHDLVNTIQKMAEKRAFVGSTVLAVNASEFFSGDIGEIDYTESELEEREAAEVTRKANTAAEVQAKMQAASKSLRGDQGDDDLVAQAGNTRVGEFEPEPYQPEGLPVVPQAPEPVKPKPTPVQNGAREWPSKLLNGLVMHFKGGNVHEYRARLNKSSMLKPDDDIKVVIHWNDIYNVERTSESIDPDEAARRADADRQATMESA